MFTNFLLSSFFIIIAICAVATLDEATEWGTKVIRFMLRFTRKSKILTEYLLRAYLRYRRAMQKGLI